MKKNIFIFLFTFLLFGCSTTKNFLVYEPSPSQEVYSFFSNGIPIVSFTSADEFILYSVEETILLSKPYLRVWLLYQNTTTTPFLLEPYNLVRFQADKENKFFSEYLAESPTLILNEIDEAAATEMIFKAIGGALEAITTEGTTIKSNTGEVYMINDKNEKRKSVIKENQIELQNTANWYNIFKNSINSGVLRKNTVFPEQSVNGYIYFPLENVRSSDDWGSYGTDIKELNFNLLINSRTGKQKINLTPIVVW